MTTLREAAQQALEALESISDCYVGDDDDAGECASCHERSYKPHAPDCKKQNAITALRAALAQQAQEPVTQMRGNALARWAHEQEEPPDTDWQRGYEAARRWVRQVGLPSLAQQTQTPCDIAEDGVCEAIDCCRNPTQEEQEPVAWLKTMYSGTRPMLEVDHLRKDTSTPVYTAPPRREWQGLTEEEMYGLYRRAGLEAYYPRDGVVQGDYDRRIDAYARAIETKLKEKNA